VNGVYSLADVNSHATQMAPTPVIDFGNGDTLTLSNVDKTSLNDGDFAFNNATKSYLSCATRSIRFQRRLPRHPRNGCWPTATD